MTRFNLRSERGHMSVQPPGWLERRMELFERYCLPSVQAQGADFEWLLFCDSETPPAVTDRLSRCDARARVVLAPAIPGGSHPELRPTRYVGQNGIVITTRFDNDDALGLGALERIQDHARTFATFTTRASLYGPSLGYRLDAATGDLYEVDARPSHSPILSLFEYAEDKPRGVLSGSHASLAERYPTVDDNSKRLWVQVVHGENIANAIRPNHREVPLEALRGFPHLVVPDGCAQRP